MNRDHFLYLLIGALVGFIAGYVLKEQMDAVQPLRRPPSAEVVQTPAPPGMGGQVDPGPAAGGGEAVAPVVRQLQERVTANPEDAEAILQLANLNFDIQNWSRAIELYDRFLELRPDQPEVLTDLGVCYRSTGRFEEALAAFDRAEALAPGLIQARYNKVVVLAFDLGRQDAAEAALAQLQAIPLDDPRMAEEVARLAAAVARQREAGG